MAEPVSLGKRPTRRHAVRYLTFAGVTILVIAFCAASIQVGIPVMRARNSRSWLPVPCVIISRELQKALAISETDPLPVKYEYTWKGIEYDSKRYSFFGAGDWSLAAKREIARRLVSQLNQTCYINPNDPGQATLDQGIYLTAADIIWPLAVSAIGAGCLVASRVRARRTWRPGTVPGLLLPNLANQKKPDEVYLVSSTAGRVGVQVFILVVWLGIAILSWTTGLGLPMIERPMGQALPIILTLSGAVIAAVSAHELLRAMIPTPAITISANQVPVGGTLNLQWKYKRTSSHIRRMTMTLVGRETTFFVHGNTIARSQRDFMRVLLCDSPNWGLRSGGSGIIKIPADLIHSLDAPNNQVEWFVELTQFVTFFPDTVLEYPLIVTPMEG